MAVIRVVLFLATVLPSGWSYFHSPGAQLLETNLLDSLGGLDVGGEAPSATQQQADSEGNAMRSKPQDRDSSTGVATS